MERFFDAVDSGELARMETMLKRGGVEYALRPGPDDVIREIVVAEEDLAYAESLLASVDDPVSAVTVH